MSILHITLAFLGLLFNRFENPTPKVMYAPVPMVACDTKIYKDKCISNMIEGFTFLKSFGLDGKSGTHRNISASYIFSKGARYTVMLANASAQTKGLGVKILDPNKKEIINSYAKEKNKYYSTITYQCGSTGIYYFDFYFTSDTPDYCGGAVLAIKR